MDKKIRENAFEITASYFENEDEDEPFMTYALDSWIPIVHLDTGEAVVWANTVKIILGMNGERYGHVMYVALPPFLCVKEHQLSGVPEEGFTFAYRAWHPDTKEFDPPQEDDEEMAFWDRSPDNLLPVFGKALAFLGFRSRTLPVGFKLVAHEEGPILKSVVTYAPRKKGDNYPR